MEILNGIEVLTVQEAAQYKGTSVPTVYRALNSGKLTPIIVFNRSVISRESLDAWVPDTRGGWRGGGRPKKKKENT